MNKGLPLKLTTAQAYNLLSGDRENIVIYDLRDFYMYEEDHILESHWYPITQIEQALEKDLGERLLILICDYELSVESLLRRKEVNHVVILAGGFKEWVLGGYPTFRLPNGKSQIENKTSRKES